MGVVMKELQTCQNPECDTQKAKKINLRPATLETRNAFNGLSAENASDANGEHYEDELPPLKSPSDSKSDTKMDDIINEEV